MTYERCSGMTILAYSLFTQIYILFLINKLKYSQIKSYLIRLNIIFINI